MMRQIHLNLYWAPATTFTQLLAFFPVLLFATVSSKPCKFSCKFSFRRITSTHSQIRLPSYCGIKSHFHVACDSLAPVYTQSDNHIVYINFIFLRNSIFLASWSCVRVDSVSIFSYNSENDCYQCDLPVLFLTCSYSTMLWYFHKVKAIVPLEKDINYASCVPNINCLPQLFFIICEFFFL